MLVYRLLVPKERLEALRANALYTPNVRLYRLRHFGPGGRDRIRTCDLTDVNRAL